MRRKDCHTLFTETNMCFIATKKSTNKRSLSGLVMDPTSTVPEHLVTCTPLNTSGSWGSALCPFYRQAPNTQ